MITSTNHAQITTAAQNQASPEYHGLASMRYLYTAWRAVKEGGMMCKFEQKQTRFVLEIWLLQQRKHTANCISRSHTDHAGTGSATCSSTVERNNGTYSGNKEGQMVPKTTSAS